MRKWSWQDIKPLPKPIDLNYKALCIRTTQTLKFCKPFLQLRKSHKTSLTIAYGFLEFFQVLEHTVRQSKI